uniref:Uncharacterized protein n=1 Tax=Aplanochytrium stocchinoi TaxID=215587 RepID=A0A7S3V3D1_9STRA|mmetsp:Transcript_14801/g.18302  ORF Transcript_14801/g.18302 Transcript_14801/m.18302 type:complete len:311 (+) Transcript_14801:298-1230(+)|eukprot:CAMPEP_0204828480 /NCGR_PEP_ID=MMETSP1346-20131115/6261_1 /ASSEMBLY_ACC=CAM_ASM_000771 /TAXON_ID=215587 /ORGANISM="Aplanochytrium stocchinoi, Strain GSBS06" /LENGTH=310 /DNA_ID=CAMNT_0051957581 /DNA_START=393 /DNA_END=1325 /DNA_ORIENTATION=-
MIYAAASYLQYADSSYWYQFTENKSMKTLVIRTKTEGAMFMERNKLNVIYYISCFAAILFVYHVLSDGDFSFLLTLGSLIQTFGVAILLTKLFRQNSFSGISLKTLQLYALVHTCRLSSILFHEGYLPYDSTGDFVIKITEISSLVMILCAIGTVLLPSGDVAYNAAEDCFGNFGAVSGNFGSLYLILPCFVLACLFHPNINKNIVTDIAWMFSNYLEIFAVVPQFYMMQKLTKAIEESIAHFCFSVGFARLFLTIFWFETSVELGEGAVATLMLVIQLIHLAIMAEFCIYYLVAAKKKEPLVLPGMMLV